MAAIGQATIQMRVQRRWWVRHYITLLALFCELFDCEPNWPRVNWWLKRGLRVELWTGSRWRRIA